YIYGALVTYGAFYESHGSWWFHATYYSSGAAYSFGLYRFLWGGLTIIAASFVLLWRESNWDALVRHGAYAGVVVVAYIIPTMARQDSFFTGAMFYGAFIV